MSQSQVTSTPVSELTENTVLLEQQRTLNSMLARSATDREFRALMLADPRAAFAAYEIQLPEGLDVRFIENRHDVTIVLPDAIDDMRELSEEELAQMGGASITSALVASSLICSAVSVSVVVTVYLTREE